MHRHNRESATAAAAAAAAETIPGVLMMSQSVESLMISWARSPGAINKSVDNGQIPKVAHTYTRTRR